MTETFEAEPEPRRTAATDTRERVTGTSVIDRAKAVLTGILRRVTDSRDEPAVHEFTIGRDSRPVGGVISGRTTERPLMADADRLGRRFLADPKSVLQRDIYAMTTSNAFVNANFRDTPQLGKSEGGPDYYFFEQRNNADVRFYEAHQSLPGVHNLEVVAAEAEGTSRVQFLPWRDSMLTYCRLDDDAHLVLTGPITGCSVYVVEVTGRGEENGTYMFHVNANSSGRKGREAAEVQVRKFGTALDRLWPNVSERTVTQRLTSDEYRVEGADPNGFVYGTRSSSSEWEFSYYFIDLGPTGRWTKRDAMPASLPRA
jgi:hypothetical protein